MQRYKVTIEYDGGAYCGFQKQFNIKQKSIEETLENAIFLLSKERVKIFASGRTDAGVHALAQVMHFDLNKKFLPNQITLGLNHYLIGEEIAILKCELTSQDFHARFSATKRSYCYKIINRLAPTVINRNRAWHVAKNLDLDEMKKAGKFLIGKHDFSSFRDGECQAKTAIRTISEIDITKNDEEILIRVSAKSFLHHMVRNIVGTLVFVGIKKFSADDVKEILASKDRTKSGPNAPAYGLYLEKIDYDNVVLNP